MMLTVGAGLGPYEILAAIGAGGMGISPSFMAGVTFDPGSSS
jgi:hypothetical protein